MNHVSLILKSEAIAFHQTAVASVRLTHNKPPADRGNSGHFLSILKYEA
ncbi:MAG: hypothetical protein ACHBN1_33195 [Heteroscytonema crispum UTEX LB 1556]